MHTRYAPVRRSLSPKTNTPRLACVRPAASVHPEPGSNSSSYVVCSYELFYRQRLGFFKSLDSLTLFYLFWYRYQNGCQFNMSMNVFFFLILRLSLKAGAKVSIFFNLASFFENIFNLFSQHLVFPKHLKNFPWRGANIKTILIPFQIFYSLFYSFFQDFENVCFGELN